MSASEAVRLFPRSIVTARCIDCGREFTGPMGVRFIETGDGPGVEIVVIFEAQREQHAVARMRRDDVPTVRLDVVPLPPAGSA